jgi:tetratricopeptide (TPR) repeat protein
MSLGVVYGRLGRHAEAIKSLRESLTIRRQLGDRHGQVEVLQHLGDALQADARSQEARADWQEALAISEALQLPEATVLRRRLASLSENYRGRLAPGSTSTNCPLGIRHPLKRQTECNR